MNPEPQPIPSLEHPKLTLLAFHLCKARTKVSDAESIWESLAVLAAPLDIPELQDLPELVEPERERISWAARSATNLQVSSHRQQQILPLLTNLPGGVLTLDIPSGETSPGLTGGIYPLLMHDSYVVDLTRCFGQAKFFVHELGHLLNPQGCLLPSQIQASIGQTLILFGRPVDWPEDLAEIQRVAGDCAAAVIQEAAAADQAQLYLSGQGRFLGGTIFEFESEHPDPSRRHHILVWLDDHPQTAQLEARGDYYLPTLQLWLSRSKIQWSTFQADLAYKDANRLYQALEKTAKAFKGIGEKQEETLWQKLKMQAQKLKNRQLKQELNKLLPSEPKTGFQERLETILQHDPSNAKLTQLLMSQLKQIREERLNMLEGWLLAIPPKAFDYAARIWDMQHQLTTITINAENFAQQLHQLQRVVLEDDDLTFLEQFLSQDCQRHQKQTSHNLDYLATGKSLFEQMIETIRGLVEIDSQKQQLANDIAERERDRNLTIWFTVVGSGLAVSGISAQIKPTAAKDALNHFGVKFNEASVNGGLALYVTTLLYHALVGVIFALLVRAGIEWIIRRFFRRSHPGE